MRKRSKVQTLDSFFACLSIILYYKLNIYKFRWNNNDALFDNWHLEKQKEQQHINMIFSLRKIVKNLHGKKYFHVYYEMQNLYCIFLCMMRCFVMSSLRLWFITLVWKSTLCGGFVSRCAGWVEMIDLKDFFGSFIANIYEKTETSTKSRRIPYQNHVNDTSKDIKIDNKR